VIDHSLQTNSLSGRTLLKLSPTVKPDAQKRRKPRPPGRQRARRRHKAIISVRSGATNAIRISSIAGPGGRNGESASISADRSRRPDAPSESLPANPWVAHESVKRKAFRNSRLSANLGKARFRRRMRIVESDDKRQAISEQEPIPPNERRGTLPERRALFCLATVQAIRRRCRSDRLRRPSPRRPRRGRPCGAPRGSARRGASPPGGCDSSASRYRPGSGGRR